MRRLNTRFFIILSITLVILSAAVFGLHRLQAGNIADALLWQANQAEKDGKPDRAAKYLGRYLEFARDDLEEREHLAMIVSDPAVAVSAQRRSRARFVIEQVLAKDPQRHVLRQRLCQILIVGRQMDPAKEHLTYLEKNQPRSSDVAYLMGQWHEAQSQSAPALDAYRRATKAETPKLEAYVRLVHLLKQSDFGKEPRHAEEIETLIVNALEKAPHDPNVLGLAAQHAQEKGDTRIALSYLEDGLKQNPAEPRLYVALARLHSQNNKRGDAIEKLKVGLQKVRKDQMHDLRWSLANLLLEDNQLEASEKLTQEIREIQPISAYYLTARCQMQLGRWFEAAKQLEKIRPALKNTKELAFQADMYLGACYEQMDEPLLQLTAFQRAADLDATSQTARRGMANARRALGQTAEALQIYQDLAGRTKDPNEAARRRLEILHLTLHTDRNQKDLKRLEQELSDIEKTLGKTLETVLARAELVFLQGNKDGAEALLQSAIKDNPDRHEPWIALISFAASKKDIATADDLLARAEQRFHAKAEFRLAQVRYWAQHYRPDAADALKRVEESIGKFTAREQSNILMAMAEVYYDAQQFADAGRLLQRMILLPQHIQDVRVRMQLLEVAILQDDDARAREILVEVKRLEGDNAGGVDWNFGEALRLVRMSKMGDNDALEKARHLLTVAAAQRPNWHPIIQVRAEIDERQGRYDQAIANYRRAIDLGSRDPQATKQLLMLLSQASRFDEVEQVLARMHKQYGATDELVRYYVANSFQRRDYRKAEYLVRQIAGSKSTHYRDQLWMGQILSASGQSSEDAEKAFRRAIAMAPDRPETWINLVRHLIGTGQNAQAKSEIENAGKALGEDSKDLTLALCFELLGFLKDAADHHKSAVEKRPTSALAHRAAAEFYLRVGAFVEAEPHCRAVLDQKSDASPQDHAMARRSLAMALVKQNRPAKTTEALQLVGLTIDEKGMLSDAKFAESADDQLMQARVLGSLNHHGLRSKAISVLERLAPTGLLNADDQYMLARLLSQQGNDAAMWAKTRNIMKGLMADHPKHSRFLAYAAHLHIQQKEYTEAEAIIVRLENVERERKTTPGGFGSTELRARLLETRGLGAQAAALLTAYAEQPEALPTRKLLLASLHGRLGNFRTAIDLCAAVRESNDYANEANAAAVGILRASKPSEAQPTKFEQWQRERNRVETMLRDGMAKNAKDLGIRLHLADLMELEGNYGEVQKLCREVLSHNPHHIVALNNLAWLLGQKSDSAAEAMTLINRAIEKFGPRPELLDTRAIVHLTLGDTAQALRELERVVNEAPTPSRLFHLSLAHERARDRKNAQAMLRRANELGLTLQQLHPAEQAEYRRVSAELAKQ